MLQLSKLYNLINRNVKITLTDTYRTQRSVLRRICEGHTGCL